MGVRGGNPRMRPDQALQPVSRSGTGPAPQTEVIVARQIIVFGTAGGTFVYNATRTVLESSDVGFPTVDPVLGISCPQGIATYNAFGAVICLLSTANNAFFQYRDLGSSVQGILILSVASVAGIDPLKGTHYPVGLFGTDTVGSSINNVGASIALGQVAYTRSAQIFAHIAANNASNPFIQIDAPEQGTASHMQQLWEGASPDGTRAPQALIGPVSGAATLTPVTNAMLEVIGGTGQTVVTNVPDATTTVAYGLRLAADTNSRFSIDGGGSQRWGTGASPQDTGPLARVGAGQLQLTGVFLLTEQASAPPTPTGAGTLYVDATGHLHYLGPGGTNTTLANP